MEAWFIITCRPSLALLRGPFIIEFRAEFSSIEGTINNHELILNRDPIRMGCGIACLNAPLK